jgi:hypothetical protein
MNKDETEIFNAIKEVQLSGSTIIRRVECISDDTEQCEFFSLQLD